MCWQTVTRRLNPKRVHFCLSRKAKEREVDLWRSSCSPWLLWIGCFLKLSECFVLHTHTHTPTPSNFPPCLCRDSARVHTLEKSRATGRPHLPPHASELSYSQPLLLLLLVYPLLKPPNLPLSTTGQLDSAGRQCGSPKLLIYKLCEWRRAPEKVPRRQKDLCLLQSAKISTTVRGLWKKQTWGLF